MEVRILGAHNAEFEGLRLPSLLIDGILAIDAGGLTSSLSLLEQQKLKAIFLTHHHFDHTRDLATFGFNGAMFSDPVKVYALRQSLDIIKSCLLDGRIYLDFSQWPTQENPFLQLKAIEPFKKEVIEGYEVLAVPVEHSVPAVGYQVISGEGKAVFYTGDTGPGLAACWERISPHLLIIEVSGLNIFEDLLKSVGHLSSRLLKEELAQFRQVKGYVPRVVIVHIPPQHQKEIEQEVKHVARELGINIDIGYEGMRITL